MSDYLLIHNPKCSKSRQTLALLEENDIKPKLLLYLEEDLTEDFLVKLFKALNKTPSECLRQKEIEFKELNLDLNDDKSIIDAIIKKPKILERPILLYKDKAVIGRPPENILNLI